MNDRPEREDSELERLRAEAADMRGRIDRLECGAPPGGDGCGCPDCRQPPPWPGWPWFIHPQAAVPINCLSLATMILAIVSITSR